MPSDWTPGPWTVVYDGNREGRPTASDVFPFRVDPVGAFDCDLPNARLIAAAPEMAEALDNIHGILQTNLGDVDPHVRSACDIAWTLLTRIRGES